MFHLCKKSRCYGGRAYCGPTSNNVPAEYETLAEAKLAVEEFTKYNPVGWDIYDSETGQLVN